jgi:hypothetical protein
VLAKVQRRESPRLGDAAAIDNHAAMMGETQPDPRRGRTSSSEWITRDERRRPCHARHPTCRDAGHSERTRHVDDNIGIDVILSVVLVQRSRNQCDGAFHGE